MFIARLREEFGDEFFATYKVENEEKFNEHIEKNKLTIVDKAQISGIIKDFIIYNYADINYAYNFIVIRDSLVENKEHVLILNDEKLRILSKIIKFTGFKIKSINPIPDVIYDYIQQLEKDTTENKINEIIDQAKVNKFEECKKLEDIIKNLLNSFQKNHEMTNTQIINIIKEMTEIANKDLKTCGIEVPDNLTNEFIEKMESYIKDKN